MCTISIDGHSVDSPHAVILLVNCSIRRAYTDALAEAEKLIQDSKGKIVSLQDEMSTQVGKEKKLVHFPVPLI